jgi:2-iminobutanoate/2-iminopropanoate deaminase
MTRKAHSSPNGPAAIGPYSHGVWAGELLFLSGQTPIDPATGALVSGGVAEQTARVFDNLEAVLADAGLAMRDVVKCNVFLTTMGDFPEMNAVYGQRFDEPFPARSTVAVAGLPLGARVEIELVALLQQSH